MKYQLSIVQFPSGRFGFVGSVPQDLAIRQSDGRPLNDNEFNQYANSSNPAMIKRSENYTEPSFETHKDAMEYAESIGYKIENR